MAARRITAREWSLIIEGLMRVYLNGEEFAAKEGLNQETRDGYTRDARDARKLREELKEGLNTLVITDELLVDEILSR